MRIAIIGYVFSGATLPLSLQFSKFGYDIDCYYLVNKGSLSVESIDFDKKIEHIGRVHRIPKTNRLYRYLPESVGVYCLPVIQNRRSLMRIHMGWLIPKVNIFFLDKYIRYIKEHSYDVINIIIQSEFELYIAQQLVCAGVKCILSFHEVLGNLNGKPFLKPTVRKAVELGTPLIFHSEKTKNDFLSLYDSEGIEYRVSVIPFGTFDSYKTFEGECKVYNEDKPFLLYMGSIHPYKGLGVLYDAAQRLSCKYKIIVAGGGFDSVIGKMKKDKRFFVINRFIKNEELVWLMRNCEAVVCPYLNASQSGLVQTAFAFKKPLIATKVGAFEEILINKYNGYLAEPADSKSLAEAIDAFYKDGIEGTCIMPEKFSWSVIAENYVKILKSIC